MALGRYDQRKNYEEAEADAIGTEYLRADLLPAAEAAKVRALLLKYLDQRVLFYGTSAQQLSLINTQTAKLQAELWSTVQARASCWPSLKACARTTSASRCARSRRNRHRRRCMQWPRITEAAFSLLGGRHAQRSRLRLTPSPSRRRACVARALTARRGTASSYERS
jgi:hypothetical protein